jgi:phosphoenolpyruvate-protein phosphotransferase
MAEAILVGLAGSPGVGVGRLLPVGTPDGGDVASSDDASRGSSDERQRLLDALATAATALESLALQVSARAGEEVGAIFEAQALFARDPGIVEPALALVESGQPPDVAILEATNRQADQLATVDDEYFRERAADLRDVGRRIAAILRGEAAPDLWRTDGQPAILVADDLDPSAVATLRPELVGGIALSRGAPTGHAAIVARALGIPLVLGLGDGVATLAPDADGAVDGFSGRLLIAPTAAEIAALDGGTVTAAVATTTAAASGIAVLANVASEREAAAAAVAGADGIGLVRTELLFLGRHAPPGVAEQRATYARIRAAMPGRQVVFRTLDIGGDKPAAWQTTQDANPALGVRGVRLGLRQSAILDDQLTALLEAAADDELHVMLPMVSTIDEVQQVRTRIDRLADGIRSDGRSVAARTKLGIMIEVPSAALMADAFAGVADFFSIGTNDLVQYTMAADRTTAGLADLATPYQPAVLRLIDTVVRAADAHGRPVAVCGEAASDPAFIPLLVGLGIHELSVAPATIASVRSRVADLDHDGCRRLAMRALQEPSAAQVRALVQEA